MRRRLWLIWASACCVILAAFAMKSSAQGHSEKHPRTISSAVPASAPSQESPQPWTFAVSGDSRNCGDIVMPAISAGVRNDGARFYWHLGDFRAIYNFDEDIQHQITHVAKPLNITRLRGSLLERFHPEPAAAFRHPARISRYRKPRDNSSKTREQYLIQFADWLDTPVLRKQRLNDDGQDFKLRTYSHWIEDGIDFISLDNATPDQFDSDQMAWFEKVLGADSGNPQIRSVVVGMHKPLPESISRSHSMNESAAGTESGRRAYADLLSAQNSAGKRVYVLGSHSHYFADGIFDTEYWRNHGGVLAGLDRGHGGSATLAFPENYRGEAQPGKLTSTVIYGER